MYRALFAFIDMRGVVGEVTVAMNNAIQASLMIPLHRYRRGHPEHFCTRRITPKRQKQLKLLIERARLHGKFVNLTDIG